MEKAELSTECLLLHRNPELVQEALEILEEEWPHEKSLREQRKRTMTEDGKDSLPCHLVLATSTTKRCNGISPVSVVGHAKLQKGDGRGDGSCAVIYSVVVKKQCRGQGFGRILMEKCEDYAMSCGMSYMYLSTKDRLGFYEHLGYQRCEPISSLGSNSKLLNSEQVEALEGLFAKRFGLRAQGASQHIWLRKRLLEEYPFSEPYKKELLLSKTCKEISSTNDVDDNVDLVGLYIDIPWQQQAGPSCGIVAINMVAQTLIQNNPDIMSEYNSRNNIKICDCVGLVNQENKKILQQNQKVSALQLAKGSGISNDGELFCAYNVCYIASRIFGIEMYVHETGENFQCDVVESLASGHPVLIPYDRAAGGHRPTFSNGRNAHWAVISGLVMKFKDEELTRNLENEVGKFTEYENGKCHLLQALNLQNLTRPVLKKFREMFLQCDMHDLFVICVHGMSRTPMICCLQDLLESNSGLNNAERDFYKTSQDLIHLRNKLVFIENKLSR